MTAHQQLPATYQYQDQLAMAVSSGEEEEDIFLCGGCKQEFNSFSVFSSHKKKCVARKNRKSTPNTNNGVSSNPNLEATAISLLANQFSQKRDDTDSTIPIWTEAGVEGGKLDGDGVAPPMICITMDSSQSVQYPDSVVQPNTECTLNFSLSDSGQLQFEHPVLMPPQPPPPPHTASSPPQNENKILDQPSNVSLVSPKEDMKGKAAGSKKPTKKEAADRKLHQCTFVGCLFVTKFSKDLTRHMTVHTGERPFTCEICLKSFGRQDKLNRHLQIHTGYKPFACAACDYKTSERSTLKKHMRVHTDERPYHCQICPYKSKDSSQLTVHLRTHTGDAPFCCQYKGCSATFKTASDLTRHVRTHTGEKPYKCDYCEYRVRIKSNLKAHVRVNHRSNEVFKCSLESCDFVTISKSELKEHNKEHGNLVVQELFSCTVCPFTTNTRHRLTTHIKLHENSKAYKCTYCAYTSKSQAILSSHINKRHAVEVNSKEKSQILKQSKDASKSKGKHKERGEDQTDAKHKVLLNKAICKPNFSCPICPAGFVRRDSLKSHIKQHKKHGVAVPPLPDNYIGGETVGLGP